MNWLTIVIIIAVVALFLTVSKAAQISEKEAVAYLKQQVPVIDVRSPGEFSSGHLTNALNISLDQVTVEVPRRYPDKRRVLLLHCASGIRSGVAQKKLSGLGYTNVFNLGSYGRAEKIIRAAQ